MRPNPDLGVIVMNLRHDAPVASLSRSRTMLAKSSSDRTVMRSGVRYRSNSSFGHQRDPDARIADHRRFLLISLADALGGSVAGETQAVPKVVAPGFDAAVYRGQDAQGDVPVGTALAFVLTKGLPIHGLMCPVETYIDSGTSADLARGCGDLYTPGEASGRP